VILLVTDAYLKNKKSFMKNPTVNEIIAESISVEFESACTYDNALDILEHCKPSVRTIALVKYIIMDMSNRSIDVKEIKHACCGVTMRIKP